MGFTTSDEYRLRCTERALQPPSDASHAGVLVGRVMTPTAAIAVGKFLMVTPVSVMGAEAEGGAGSVVASDPSVTIPVFLVGPAAANQGDLLVCRFIDYRWAAERCRRSDVGHLILGCPCSSIPTTLFLNVANPPSNGNASLVYPATLHWQVKPADMATYRSDDPGYYTDTVFSSTDGSYQFRYKFGCSQGFYYVSGLIVPGSPLGYPGEFAIMQWLVGLPGNTCLPFRLTAGGSGNVDYRNQGISIDGASG